MKITRDVITDLLPVYFSGEASEDTRSLVEAYFRENPEFEALARQSETQLDVPDRSSPADQKEKETMMRIKGVLRRRSILLGIALFCSLMPFSIAGNEHGITWIMMRDLPGVAGIFAVAALLVWGAYFWTFRAVRDA